MEPVEVKTNPPRKVSICLITTRFGSFPPYFECVLRSCALNPDIHWLIFSDDTTERTLPPNVVIKQTSLKELRGLFCAKLGMEVALEKPLQLCNLKPAFGYLFAESLANYEFWGHCDLDMIFGDIRKFLNKEIFSWTKSVRFHITVMVIFIIPTLFP